MYSFFFESNFEVTAVLNKKLRLNLPTKVMFKYDLIFLNLLSSSNKPLKKTWLWRRIRTSKAFSYT